MVFFCLLNSMTFLLTINRFYWNILQNNVRSTNIRIFFFVADLHQYYNNYYFYLYKYFNIFPIILHKHQHFKKGVRIFSDNENK